jgi:2,3-dihydroxybenzoate-AMP ligase
MHWGSSPEEPAVLAGVTPFPPEFAARYRAEGYWTDRPLRAVFADAFARFADRVAVIDGADQVTYRQLDERSTRLALNLLELGVRPLDRIVVQLPNGALFCYLYLALQKIGAIPILALPSHRYREVSQFVDIGAAIGCAVPARHRDFDYVQMVRRIRRTRPELRLCLVQDGDPGGNVVRLEELLDREPRTPPGALDDIAIDPADPAVFLLSGGTTGIPKLIPRSHNDYAYNTRIAVSVCDVRDGDVLLVVLPIEHNLPLACPGWQGFLLRGATAVLSTSARPDDVFALVQRHRVTHLQVVPTLLIRWTDAPTAAEHDLTSVRVVQSGGQRLQPETRVRTERVLPHCTVQENFGMAEGLLLFVRLDDDETVRRETCGRPICPDDEIRLVDDDGVDVAPGAVGELWARGPYTLRGYFRAPEHNARAFTPDGFYRSGDLMWRHPSGNYVVAGRKKDLVNRGGEKISAEEVENLILAHPHVLNVACVPVPDEMLGERMCACVVLRPGTELTLTGLVDFLLDFEIAKHKLPERLVTLDRLPLSPVGKVSKKDLVGLLTAAGATASQQTPGTDESR